MDYRLARLQEQTDIDWNDGELLFRLYLSLHNLKYNKCNKVTEAESDE
jgi:DNA-binding PucR family transcriptional regulator